MSRATAARCAIYTRKSSDEGLEQEFNSLHAQREACEAYITSQKHEGWTCLPETYDDGGLSGATMERPALQRLLDDIRQGKVDVVVVYKVDRLTRALSDFARIVETFDGHGVSFVSVTQQFNTTSSMGRLTLNVLLSFAQFEREVTGERIRDKIAASKKKGMWMGGTVPLGYDVVDRKLVVNKTEARTVRTIFRRYVELGSLSVLKRDLDAQGIVSKARKPVTGNRPGGLSLSIGGLAVMLRNPAYIGVTRHKDNTYPGEHKAIISQDLWNQVQATLKANSITRRTGTQAIDPSLLAGLVFDSEGHRLIPSHANKSGRRYRYYVSRPLIVQPGDTTQGIRLPAPRLERVISNRLRALFADSGQVLDMLMTQTAADANLDANAQVSGAQEPGRQMPGVQAQQSLISQANTLAVGWEKQSQAKLRAILLALVARIDITTSRIRIHIVPGRFKDVLEREPEPLPPASTITSRRHWKTLSAPVQFKRRGSELRLVIGNATQSQDTKPDPALVKLMVRAHRFRELLIHNEGQSLEAIAKAEGINCSYFTRVLRLAWLAPDLTRAILDGQHPSNLIAETLRRNSNHLPVSWTDQREWIVAA
ncbi:MAG: recombinase family protein [Alphaproteobacteria bacterium]